MKSYLLIGVFILSILAGVVIFQATNSPSGFASGVEVDWRMLGELDYVTGHTPSELKALDGEKVKIPGFMVPLEDEMKNVSEFLLVPTPQACIHVPAPPPNQMLYIKMKKPVETAYGPIWVYGKLNIVTKRSMYGEASFEIEADGIEPYR